MRYENSHGRKNAKRITVKKQLENQLKSGVKPVSRKHSTIELTDEDRNRIEREIKILDSKIMNQDSANAIRTKKMKSERGGRRK